MFTTGGIDRGRAADRKEPAFRAVTGRPAQNGQDSADQCVAISAQNHAPAGEGPEPAGPARLGRGAPFGGAREM